MIRPRAGRRRAAIGAAESLEDRILLDASMHGRKFNDVNANGLRDAGEPYLNGTTIYLFDENGVLLDTQITHEIDANTDMMIDPDEEVGLFWFNDLLDGIYTVGEELLPGHAQTQFLLPLPSGISAGFDLFTTQAGTTSADIDPDGPGGLPPVTVPLQGAPFAGGETDTVVERLAPLDPLPVGGGASIQVELVALQLQSIDPVNINGTDFDVLIQTGSLLNSQQSAFFINQAIPNSSQGSMTINRTHQNGGTVDFSLPLNARVVFTQVGAPGNTMTETYTDTITGSTVWSFRPTPGEVRLSNAALRNLLPSGEFYPGVDYRGEKVVIEDDPLAPTYAVMPAVTPQRVGPGSQTHQLIDGDLFADRDFGNTVTSSIHGFKFEDVNVNGTYEAGTDLPIPNVTFTLTGTDGAGNPVGPIPVTTDANGEFWWDGLLAGNYTVTETVPPGWAATTPTSFVTPLLSGEELVWQAGRASLNPSDPQVEVVVGADLMFGNRPLLDFGDAPDLIPGRDADADGIDDEFDNCHWTANLAQTNTDGDSAGDACDPVPGDSRVSGNPLTFRTALVDDGPRHLVTGLRLGTVIESESDGQPNADATGDDVLGVLDDEDGVTGMTAFVPGRSASIDVVASAAGMLDAWMDINGNGRFDHPDEHIGGGGSVPLVAGTNAVGFNVPADAVVGTTYARLRFSTAGGLPPTGFAEDGEVEDYEVEIQTTRGSVVGRDPVSGGWQVAASNGSSFVSQVWGNWSPTAWGDVMSADVNGDGNQDVVGRNLVSGDWWVALSDGIGSFTNQLWGHWTPVAWLDVNVADVNNDGNDDIVGRTATGGDWWVALSDGAGSFINQLWGGWTPVAWLDVNVADVNNDGDDDIVGRTATGGDWWVALSDGVGSFANELWGGWTPVAWLDVNVADVNNDGNDDIVGRTAGSGDWWVALSDGVGSFANELWGAWTPVAWLDVNVADVNNDGNDDIVGRTASGGRWWVALSDGAGSFVNELWGVWSAGVTWLDVQILDADGDGDDDIVGREQSNGRLWVARAHGIHAFVNELWGVWNPAVAWTDVGLLDDVLTV